MANSGVGQSNFTVPHDLISMSIFITKELFIGILIGYSAGLIFVAIQIGGQLLSMQMGLTIAEALDPVTKQQVPIIGQFYLFIASMSFIYINGHHWLFTTVIDSYNTIPIGLNFDFTSGMVEKLLFFIGQLFTIAFGIVIPIFGLLFVIDIALAFIARMMPQMNIFMVSLPLKIYVGLGLMIISLTTISTYLSGLIGNMLENLKTIFM